MELVGPLGIALVGLGLALALVVYLVLDQAQEKSTIRASLRQLDNYEVESIRDKELLNPLRQRVVIPVAKAFTGLGRRFTPQGYVDSTKRKLSSLGRGSAEDLDRFLAVRVITIVLVPVAAILAFVVLPLEGRSQLLVFGLLGLFLVLGPDAILNRKVEERQHAIRVALPDILDLLTISVEAGLGFEQALDRTVSAVPGPLSEEFIRMLGEVRAGASRSQAMRSMEKRIDVPEIRSFTLAILQADTFGISISRVLRTQADEMRVKRRQLAQEAAQKAPVKMLFPMVFCIFPSLFVVILGPAVINIFETLG